MAENSFNPLLLGLLAGITVYMGAIISAVIRSSNKKVHGFLNGIAGGILGYLAYEATLGAEEALAPLQTLKTLNEFIMGLVISSGALLGTWLILATIEARVKKDSLVKDFGSPSQANSLIASVVISVALGVHNIGEGFAISASLIQAKTALALLFTIGFAVHNATEGFAIMAPIMSADVNKDMMKKVLLILPALAGLPTILGAAIYYVGSIGNIWLATLNTIAAASIVYAMLKVNLTSAASLGGFNKLFWTALFTGTAMAYTLESIIVLTLAAY